MIEGATITFRHTGYYIIVMILISRLISLPNATLYGELGLVNLVGLIPSIGPYHARTSS